VKFISFKRNEIASRASLQRGQRALNGDPFFVEEDRQQRNTVALSNGELRKLGISRQTKYRALGELREAGAIAIEEADTRRSVRVTVLWFP